MPEKVCPVCGKRRSPAEAADCRCGYVFDVERVQILGPDGRQVCPRCGQSCARTAPVCACGHCFDEDPETVRHILLHKLTLGWFGVVGGALLALGGGVLLMATLRTGLAAIIIGCTLVTSGAVKIASARRGLAVYKLPDKLPQAKLLKR